MPKRKNAQSDTSQSPLGMDFRHTHNISRKTLKRYISSARSAHERRIFASMMARRT